MITRIREEGGGFKVTILSADGIIDERVTGDLAEAFAWQKHVQATGVFPVVLDPIDEPEVKKAKGKKK